MFGDKAAWGEGDFSQIIVDDIVLVLSAGEQHAVEIDLFGAGEDDDVGL